MSNSEDKNNRNKILLIISIAALVIAIISLAVMVKTCALTEKSIETTEKAEELQKAEKKAEKLRNANIMFEYANNTVQYLEAHKIYKEILYIDSTDTTGYYNFFNKAKDRFEKFQKCDDMTEWFLERAKELTKELKQIEKIDNLLKECEHEKY